MKRCFSSLAAVGIWFVASSPLAQAQPVKADTGGVAIGRDVIQSTINIGIPPRTTGGTRPTGCRALRNAGQADCKA
jgi:hypothetical protein